MTMGVAIAIEFDHATRTIDGDVGLTQRLLFRAVMYCLQC